MSITAVFGSLVRLSCLLAICSQSLSADDWPTWRHDQRRSGATNESLDFVGLQQAWMHRPQLPPSPAWPGPARWDAYVKRPLISSMRNYDESFHVTSTEGAVYFGSSADDSLHCLNMATGTEQWVFSTAGPVRHPPTIDQDRLYFGSDDGFVYCLSATTRQLLWKFRPASAQQVLQDGRLISAFPIRTGVLVQQNKVYFGASLLPWEKSYLCCVDAHTGRADAAETYVQELTGATLEGSILSADDHLVVTQGRSAPLWATRSTGNSRGVIPGVHGGSFAVIAEDGSRFVGPGPREGFFSEANATHTTTVARKFGAVAMVAHEGLLYTLERAMLGCFRQKNDEWLWRRPCDLSESLILVGDHLIAGGNGKLAAFRKNDGTPVWQAQVEGRVQGLAVAHGTLLVSTDEGLIYAFRSAKAAADGSTTTPPEVAYRSVPQRVTEPGPATTIPPAMTLGPIIRFPAPGEAVVAWTTAQAMPTTLAYGIDDCDVRNHNPQLTTQHEVRLRGLQKNTVYQLAIVLADGGKEQTVGPLECDTHMNMSPAALPATVLADRGDAATALPDIQPVLQQLHRTRGICAIVGADALPWGVALARQSEFRTVVFDEDEDRLTELRGKLQRNGLLGSRISLIAADDVRQLPTTDHFANLVIVSPQLAAKHGQALVDALLRKAVPGSGTLLVAGTASHDWRTAPPLTDIGTWSHQYGRPDNATFANESLQGACRTSDFRVQWLGRPGPRFQSDRGNRKPAPLFAGGRLLVQGLDRLMALDAYNGTVLWNLEVPDSRRFNIRNDSANWCLDDEHMYLAVRDACWQLDAATGQVQHVFRVARSPDAYWGYVGRYANRLVGSCVSARSAYQDFWGGQYWYTASDGPLAAKVCSQRLFAHDVATGQLAWEYTGGTIVNTSITLADGQVLFVESRHPEVMGGTEGRISNPKLWEDLHLVALSIDDGRRLWQRPIDVGIASTMFSLASGNGHIVAVASRKGDYQVAVFAANNGQELWRTTFPWEANGKGGDSARPVIIDDKLYVSPRAFALKTGESLPQRLTRGACGSYAAAKNVFITRLGNLGLWDPQAGQASGWKNLRPDCWLSAIPAGGLILAPEGGGGCSCGGWIETSITFSPKPKE